MKMMITIEQVLQIVDLQVWIPERVREIASKGGRAAHASVMHMSLPLKKLVKLAEQPMQVVTLMNLPLKKRVKRCIKP